MNRFLLTVFLCISWTPLAFSDSPCYWKGICKSGVKQSPINIKSNDATVDKALGSFTLKNYDKKPTNITFTARNDGHTLTFVPSEDVYSVSGGGLVGNYSTAGFHLHWGSINTQGSEHNLDGEKFAAELHFVSWNTKYSNLSEAKDKSDGLAVLGVFIKVEGDGNAAFSFLENANKSLIYKGSQVHIPAFKLNTILPSDQTKYFRYNGSLTIPGCQESVIWTVFNEPVKISQYQINILRRLKGSNNASMENNYRNIQQLNNREVKASFQVPTPSSTARPPTKTCSGSGSVNMAAGLFSLMLFAALIGIKMF